VDLFNPWRAWATRSLGCYRRPEPVRILPHDCRARLTAAGDSKTNIASVVLLINHGAVKFLFTGDIDSTQEAKVLAHGTPVAADILKVAHHGSNGSSGEDFLMAVAPKDAVISVGTMYGHPGADTLSRLLAVGARIWQTNQGGTVVVVSDGSAYQIHYAKYMVFLPFVAREGITPNPTAIHTPVPGPDLYITTLSGSTTPEYVVITNSGTGAQNMTGWTLVSVVGSQTFTFPSRYLLDARANVRIESYTGATDNPPAVLLWNYSAIWSNNGDKAELRDAGNGLVDSVCYGSGCP
jgi:competence protein ComEC